MQKNGVDSVSCPCSTARAAWFIAPLIAAILMTEVFNTRWFYVVRRAIFPSDVFDQQH